MDLATRILTIRTRMGQSQEKFGEMVGKSQRTVAAWESGSRVPSFTTLCKLADTLNLSIDYLLGRTEAPELNADTKETEDTDLPYDQIYIGSIVVFDMGTFPNIGIITSIDRIDGRLKCTIMHPSGRLRLRDLDFDYQNTILRPLLGEFNTCIHSPAWDKWIADGKPRICAR